MIRRLPAIIEFLGYDPAPEPEALSLRIAYARRRMGWTQEDLARAVGVGDFIVYRWESGSVMPSPEKLSEFQKYLADRFRLI